MVCLDRHFLFPHPHVLLLLNSPSISSSARVSYLSEWHISGMEEWPVPAGGHNAHGIWANDLAKRQSQLHIQGSRCVRWLISCTDFVAERPLFFPACYLQIRFGFDLRFCSRCHFSLSFLSNKLSLAWKQPQSHFATVSNWLPSVRSLSPPVIQTPAPW